MLIVDFSAARGERRSSCATAARREDDSSIAPVSPGTSSARCLLRLRLVRQRYRTKAVRETKPEWRPAEGHVVAVLNIPRFGISRRRLLVRALASPPALDAATCAGSVQEPPSGRDPVCCPGWRPASTPGFLRRKGKIPAMPVPGPGGHEKRSPPKRLGSSTAGGALSRAGRAPPGDR